MIGLKITVPIACWRKGHARELLETHEVPPPATCYGALLSFVGEADRARHVGARVTAGLMDPGPDRSTVLRTLWQVKSRKKPQGTGDNAGPDFQQLVTNATVVVWCDSVEETASPTLEERLRSALEHPSLVDRFGGLALGESTHLVNDLDAIDGPLEADCLVFVQDPEGDATAAVWVDHVGTAGTRYVTGRYERQSGPPAPGQAPRMGP